MLSEEFPVEVILEAIDDMAATTSPFNKRPKVILFDIGGVCVSHHHITSVTLALPSSSRPLAHSNTTPR